jgi:hypothetical protein
MEFRTGGSFLGEATLALGGYFYSSGFLGWIPEVAELLIAPAVGIGSLGVGFTFSYSP